MPEPIQVNSFENLKDVKSLAQWVAEKNDEVQRFIKSNDAKGWDNDTVGMLDVKTAEVEAAQTKLTQLQRVEDIYNKTVERKKDLSEPAPHVPFENNGGDPTVTQNQGQGATKSLGELFTENKTYKSFGSHEENNKAPFSIVIPDFNFQDGLKTVMTTTAGYAPAKFRNDVVVPYAQREPRLTDLIPVTNTPATSVFYMEETTAMAGTNAQVGTAENALKFENTLAFTEREAKVGLIATWIAATLQQLDDVPGMQSIINSRMTDFLRLKEEDMLLTGTGVAPINILGFLALPSINTQATGADTNIDAVFRAMQKVRTIGFSEPDAVVMHPDNFTPIALYKSSVGEYGFNVTVDDAGVTRLFGKTLVLSPAVTAGTALVGSFRTQSHIYRRQGLSITVGLNADDFTKNKRTILGEMREALAVFRQTSFTKITGLV